MKTPLLLSCVLLLAVSCKKDRMSISSADFTVDKEVVYISEPVRIKAVDTTGENGYHYDFGDGKQSGSGPNTAHAYEKEGQYKITVSIYGKSSSREITVLPGIMSYQIKNSSTRELDILSYLDNPQNGTFYRDHYAAGKLGDSLFASYHNLEVTGTRHAFQFSIVVHNKEYVPYINSWTYFDERKHSTYEITDSTQVTARSFYANEPETVYYVKDL